MSRSRLPSVALLFLASLLVGCHPDGSGQVGPSVPLPPRVPTVEQTHDVGDSINEHTQDLLVAFNVQELLLFELPLGAERGPRSEPWMARGGSCPTVDNDADLDGDGIPDDATFTFSGSACTVFVDSVGTFEQSGSIHVVDAGVTPGYTLTYQDFRVRLDGLVAGDYVITTANGTYDVTATSATATLQESIFISIEEHQGVETTLVTQAHAWTAEFVATGPDPVDLAIPLPVGSVTVEGTTTWTSPEVSFTFDVSTPQALAFDADCLNGPEFLSGRIMALEQAGGGAFIDVVYLGCAIEPVIVLRPGT